MNHKTAAQLGQEIGAGKLDPVELAEECFDRIETSGIASDVFARLTRDRAKTEAVAACKRQKSGERIGPLDGVPVSWKDLFDTKDIATESGTLLLEGRTPDEDCEVLRRAVEAGTVCIGKTHMSELAFSGLGINPNTGTPPNIHGSELAPGGSSSGAGASVAFGFVPIGIGSDTGGSVRIPSAWNDLVGLKTTHGLIPTGGVIPLCRGFDTVGPLCLNVEDAALMHCILAGEPVKLPEAKPLSECKFLVSETITLDECGEDQLTGFHAAVDALGKAGATIEYGQIPEFEDTIPLGFKLFPYEAYSEWGEEIEASPELMFEPVRDRFLVGRKVTMADYEQAWDATRQLRKSYLARVEAYDAVLAPTVPVGPPNVEMLLNDHELFSSTNLKGLRNTRFGNMLGLCALTLPTNRPASGIMFMGAPLTEMCLLSVGLSAEQAINNLR